MQKAHKKSFPILNDLKTILVFLIKVVKYGSPQVHSDTYCWFYFPYLFYVPMMKNNIENRF